MPVAAESAWRNMRGLVNIFGCGGRACSTEQNAIDFVIAENRNSKPAGC